jgi:outer membrane protein assembly factor BamB
MPSIHTEPSSRRLRLWPGILIATVVVVARFIVPLFAPAAAGTGMLTAAAGLLLLVLWWLFFSRAPWGERFAALALIVAAAAATRWLAHPSIQGGMMGLMLFIYAIPATVVPLFVAWAVVTQRTSGSSRYMTMAAAILLGCGVWLVARTDGLRGETGAQLAWRWTPTAEERLLAQASPAPLPVAAAMPSAVSPAAAAPAEPRPAEPAIAVPEPAASPETTPATPPAVGAAAWPGFRGTHRDGFVRNLRIDTDWARTPPREVWRHPIGPGWSSFAVSGELIYTQEQRGEHELVSAYRLDTGEPVWRHRDEVRFYESNGGAGPRATPTVHEGRIYALGATGILNVLDAATGALAWSRHAQADTGATLPGWGFAGSPVIAGDAVIVAASGRLAAYDLTTGEPRWTRMTGGGGYSSPHLVTLDGVPQILLLSGGGITSVSPADGAVLWQHPGGGDVSIVQPGMAPNGDVLVAAGDMMGGAGIRRVALRRDAGVWTVEERWASRGLKPNFNDFVVHDGHAYGFDGTILSCISLETGERAWKGGRYGAGQLILLGDSDVLLVLGEEGQLALVAAAPDGYRELAKVQALGDKTWNHPVVVGDVLLVRNGVEMAAYRLPLRDR